MGQSKLLLSYSRTITVGRLVGWLVVISQELALIRSLSIGKKRIPKWGKILFDARENLEECVGNVGTGKDREAWESKDLQAGGKD